MGVYFIEISAAVFFLSCLSCTLLMCSQKWGLLTLYELHRRKWMPPNYCVFCIGFWFSFILLTAAYFIFNLDELFFICPFASASLTYIMYASTGAVER